MAREKQDITLRVYPPHLYGDSELWHYQAYVFGDWAVHRPHPREIGMLGWTISHIPTGVAGFETAKMGVALQAALRLSKMEQPPVVIITPTRRHTMPHVAPLPMEWIAQSAALLSGMDIFCRSGDSLVRPEKLVEHINRVRLAQPQVGTRRHAARRG